MNITNKDTAREALDPCPTCGSTTIVDGDCPHCNPPQDALHVDPQEAYEREVEIGTLAAQLRAAAIMSNASTPFDPVLERGITIGLSAYRECYELVRLMEPLWADPHDTNHDPKLAELAQAALERAGG